MPVFQFTSPDGKKYRVNGPEGSTNEQAFGVLQNQISAGSIAPYQAPEPDNESGIIDSITNALSGAGDIAADTVTGFTDAAQSAGQNAVTLGRLALQEDQFTPEQLDDRVQQRIWAGTGEGKKDELSPVGQEVLAGLPNQLGAALQGALGDGVNFVNNASKAAGIEGDGIVSDISDWFYKNEQANEQASLNKGLDLSRLDPGSGAGAMVAGFKSAVSQAPMLALGVAGKPIAGLLAMGVQVAGDEKRNEALIKKGFSPQAAFGIQILDGTIEAGSEKLSLDRLIGKWGKNWMEEAIKYAAVETTSEISAEGLNALVDKYITGLREDMTLDDFVGDVKVMMAQLPYAAGAQVATAKGAQFGVKKAEKMSAEQSADDFFKQFDAPLNNVAQSQASELLNPKTYDPALVNPTITTQQTNQVGPGAGQNTANEKNNEAVNNEAQRLEDERAARNQKADQEIEIADTVNAGFENPTAIQAAFDDAGISQVSDINNADINADRRDHVKQVANNKREEVRRQDVDARKRVDQMTQDEMSAALLISDKSGLRNERAYSEDKQKKHQSFFDVDDFKAMNSRLTYEGADKALEEVGRIMREQAGDLNIPYHLHGDEFITQSDDPKALDEFSQRVQNKLNTSVVKFTLPDGKVLTEKGIGVSYGIGSTKQQAESNLTKDKERRKQSGERVGVRAQAGGESDAVHGEATQGDENNERENAAITLSSDTGSDYSKTKSLDKRFDSVVKDYENKIELGTDDAYLLDDLEEKFSENKDVAIIQESDIEEYGHKEVGGVSSSELMIIDDDSAINNAFNESIINEVDNLDDTYYLVDHKKFKTLVGKLVDEKINRSDAHTEKVYTAQDLVSELISSHNNTKISPDNHRSDYLNVETVDKDGEIVDFEVRIKDHDSPSGGGINAGTGEKYGDTDLDIVVDEDGVLSVRDVTGIAAETELFDKLMGLNGKNINDSQEKYSKQTEINKSNKDGLSVSEVTQTVEALSAKWKNAPDISIVQSQSELPKEITGQANDGDVIDGVFYDNKVYLVADNLVDEKSVEFTLLHESLLHYGARQTFDDKTFDDILVYLWNNNDSIKKGAARKITDLGVNKKEAVEEVLADMAGNGATKKLKGWEKLWSFVKGWLAKNGFTKLNSNDVVDQILRASEDAVIEGRVKAVNKTSARFSRNSDNQMFSVADETTKDKVARKLQDKFQRLYKAQQAIGKIETDSDAYAAEARMHGKIEYDFENLENDYIEPLASALAEYEIEIAVLDEYLMAKHAPERNDHVALKNKKFPDAGSGITTDEANKTVSFLEKKYGDDIKKVAQKVYDLLEYKRKILRKENLGNDELIDNWEVKYKYYVPLKGFAEDSINDEFPRIGKGLSISGKESQAAKGRKSKAFSPVTQSINDAIETIIRARKNEVGLHLLRLVESNPNKEYWEIFTDARPDKESVMVKGKVQTRPVSMRSNPDYFGVKLKGEQHYIKLKDKRLASAMQNLGVEKQNVLVQTMGSTIRFLSSMNTSLNPEFIVSNFSRDIQTAVYNILAEQDLNDGKISGEKIAEQVVKDVPKAMRSIYRELRSKDAREDSEFDQYAKDFIADGGKTGFFDMKDLEAQKRHLQTLITISKGGTKGKSIKAIKSIGKFVDDVNGAVENGVRLSAYINARKTLESSGISESVSRKRAANLAKDLTVNFNRRGEWSTVANGMYMFFNASAQGTAQFSRVMLTMKKVDGKKRLHMAQKVAIGMTIFAYALAHLNRAIALDDDDGENIYDKIPSHIKERNLIIMDMFGDKAGKDYTSIPLPYGYNIFHVLGTTINDTIHGTKKLSDAAQDLTMALLGSFNPVGISESESFGFGAFKTITPTVLTPAAELYGNENFFGSPIYNKDKFNDRTPDSSLSFNSTKEHFKNISQWLNEITGGSMYEKGMIDLSPDSLEHLFEFATGGAGRFVGKVANVTDKIINDEPLRTREIPFLSKVRGEPNEYNADRQYYERRSVSMTKMDVFKSLKGEERKQYREENENMLKMARFTKRYDGKLSALRKRRDRQLMKDLDRKQIKKIKDKNLDDSISIYNEFNLKWNQLIEKN